MKERRKMFKNTVFKVSVSTKEWIKATAVSTIRTMAQSAISVIGVTSVIGEVNWLVVGSSALLSGILCILTALAGLPEVESEEIK